MVSGASSEMLSAAVAGMPEEGIRFTSSRASRQAAWMIQETERSCLMASFWVSANMAELKYRVTLRF